jgi:hypothetical protein
VIRDDQLPDTLVGRPDANDPGHMIVGPAEEGTSRAEYAVEIDSTSAAWTEIANAEEYQAMMLAAEMEMMEE